MLQYRTLPAGRVCRAGGMNDKTLWPFLCRQVVGSAAAVTKITSRFVMQPFHAIFAIKSIKMIQTRCADIQNEDLTHIRELYETAFPVDERREWTALLSLCRNRSHFSLHIIYDDDRQVGFITVWQWDGWRYIEHFAVDASCRGKGIGGDVLRAFLAGESSPVVLEVEIPSDEISRRRVEFYRRLGFELHDSFSYIQPPYGEGRKALPMFLMTCGAPSGTDLQAVVDLLYRDVYGVKEPHIEKNEAPAEGKC